MGRYPFEARSLVFAVLLVLVVWSAFGVIFFKYESRKLFGELESIRVQKDRETVNWGRLNLELATLAEHGRIENIAVGKLDMLLPGMGDIVILRP